jgi:glutamyl-tRNA reductase
MHLICISFHHIKTGYDNFLKVKFVDPEQFYKLTRGERVLLQTGTRVEVYVYADDPDSLFDMFISKSGLSEAEIRELFDVYVEREATLHLFRMAGSIESRVLGETYIPLAVESAFQLALENGAAGPHIKELFGGAIRVGKRARGETKIEGTVPITDIALKSIKDEISKIEGKKIVLLGAGTTGRKIAKELSKDGAELTIINRNQNIGQIIAQKVGGIMHDYPKLTETLRSADILICATLASHYRVLPEMIEKRSSPLIIVDVSPFGNVNPEVAAIDKVILKNGELENAVKENHETAKSEIPNVENIISEEL